MPDLWMDVDAALSEVPICKMPLIDDTDFKTREESVAYNQAGLDLLWNFVTTAGAFTQTAVTPTDSGGDYDWVNQGNGLYTIEIPASGGASINNDTEGFGYFSGYATGILPWIGPIIGFRDADLNNLLIDSAYSATRGLAGTALPAAAADGAGGLPISDAGGLDMDSKLANTNEVTAARMGALTDWINGGRLDLLIDAIKLVTDNLPNSGALNDLATLAARLTAARAGYLDELAAANIPADLDTLKGYCDILDHATNGLANIKSLIDAIKAKTDNLPADPADDSDIDAQLATIAGYLDTEISAIKNAIEHATYGLSAIRARGDIAWITGGGGTAQQVVDALMADTGFTQGGTLTFEKAMNIQASWIAGNWRLKSGTTSTYELLDVDDGSTVILEMTLSQTTPFRTITVKI